MSKSLTGFAAKRPGTGSAIAGEPTDSAPGPPAAEPPPIEPKPLAGCQQPGEPSSRTAAKWAGWTWKKGEYEDGRDGWTWVKDSDAHGNWDLWLRSTPNRRWRDFSWLSARALLDSINDQIAKLVHDIVNGRRQRWIAGQRVRGTDSHPTEDFVIQQPDWSSMLIVGDPGEADASQYAVVGPLLAVDQDKDSDFMLILSDVIYPAGDINDYINGFYVPYQGYRKPILALPGNHDWYDGLNGFMFHFCGAEALPPTEYRGLSFTFPERVARYFWRKADRPKRAELLHHRATRVAHDGDRWEPPQPAPYWAMDMGPVRLVSIDTGIGGTLDGEQGEWLYRVSRDPARPKVLLTGKPIWVDGKYHPTPIEWDHGALGPNGYETVDDMVLDPANRYVAAIGGDVHNYQRYTVTVRDDSEEPGEEGTGDDSEKPDDTRTIEYIVSGGGGAFMSAPHRFGIVDNTERESPAERAARFEKARGPDPPRKKPDPVPPDSVGPIGEAQFRSYPVRGDSLAFYARSYGRFVFWAALVTLVAAAVAALTGVLWHRDGSGVGDQTVAEIAAAAVGGVIGLGLVAVAAALAGRFLAPRGSKTTGAILFGAAALALGWWLLADAWDWEAWNWIWKVILITLGDVALPVALIAGAYYGVGSSSPGFRSLLVSTIIVAEVVVFFSEDLAGDALELLLVGALSLLAIAGLYVFITRVASRRRVLRGRKRRPEERFENFQRGVIRGVEWLATRPAFVVPATVIGYSLFIVPVAIRFWDAWAIQVAVVAFLVLVVVIALAVWGLVVASGAIWALWWFRDGRVDPDKAVAYVHREYGGDETEEARRAGGVDDKDRRTRAICSALLPPAPGTKGIRRLLNSRNLVNKFISEIGNADDPPMFKHFLHLGVKENVLEISCYGVTGWAENESDIRKIPREDCVRIALPEPAMEERAQEPPTVASIVEQLNELLADARRILGLG